MSVKTSRLDWPRGQNCGLFLGLDGFDLFNVSSLKVRRFSVRVRGYLLFFFLLLFAYSFLWLVIAVVLCSGAMSSSIEDVWSLLTATEGPLCYWTQL